MRIDPVADNEPLLDLVEHGFGGDISGIKTLLSDFGRTARAEKALAEERIRGDLLKRGISGSAVMPNLGGG